MSKDDCHLFYYLWRQDVIKYFVTSSYLSLFNLNKFEDKLKGDMNLLDLCSQWKQVLSVLNT